MSRKLTALMLSVFMVLSLFAPLSNLKAQDANLNDGIHNQRPVDIQNAIDYKALDEVSDKEEERSFIFVTDESSKVAEKVNEAYESLDANEVAEKGIAHLMKSGFNDAISGAMKNLDFNSEVKEKINSVLGRHQEGLLYSLKSMFFGNRDDKKEAEDEGRDFNVVFSGFTMKMTTKEAMKVRENVPEVKQVFIDYTYKRPEEKVNMYNSAGMVKAPEVWRNGYKGEGRVVAVIDSGADITHPAMRLTNPDKAKYNKAAIDELIKSKLLKGQYLTPKFPYGYNYMDKNMVLRDDNKDTGMHGMHVSGTVGANATEEEAKEHNGGLVIKGVAPEAQILVMRVFGQEQALTNTSAYIEAIEESIILGADSMNMSLGSMAGSESSIDLGMALTLENAKKSGAIVAIAAGNDFYSTSGFGNPRANNPDWGVMGTPGVAESALTVANFNNEYVVTDASTFIKDDKGSEIEIVAKPVDTIDTVVDTGFESLKEYEIVDVGLGNKIEEYKGQDVKGKVVLAQRGDGNFADKIMLAKSQGAIAFLLGNNEVKKPDFFIIMQTETDNLIPAYSVTYRNYMAIKKNMQDVIAKGEKPTIKIDAKRHKLDNSGKYKMNESTSWGPNTTLRLKPEIAAPGGNIFSTVNVNNGRYADMTGTSMATPHVAGGIALVNEFLAKKGINVKKEKKSQFIKNILMATSDPLLFENKSGLYYSPRVQGSGLMNLENAVNPNLVTVVDARSDKMSTGKAVVEFGSIKDGKLAFNIKLHNYSDKAVTYKVHGIAQTDQIENGKVTFAPINLANKDMGTVTVEAGQDAEFTGTIDVSDSVTAQKSLQPNGFFVDGFIFFESQATTEGAKLFSNISIPYLAFYGDWNKLPILDVFPDEIVFEQTATEKKWIDKIPFWYQGTQFNGFPGNNYDNWNFTHFYSKWSDGGRVIQSFQPWSGKYINSLAISPNGDSQKDEMSFRGVFLRNTENIKFDFINEAGDVVNTIAEPYRSVVKKNTYKNLFYEDPIWTWRGEDKNGGQVPDGKYTVKISANAQDNPNSEQEYTKTVYVDRVKPEIELIKAEKNGNIVELEFKAKDTSGIAWMDVANLKNAQGNFSAFEWNYEAVPNEPNSAKVVAKWVVAPDFDLEAAKNDVWLQAMDMAGNFFESRIADLGNKGKVNFVLKSSDHSDESYPKELPRLYYEIMVQGKPKKYYTTFTTNLAYTKYTVAYPDPFAGYDVKFEPSEFTLSDTNSEQTVNVTFTKKDDSKFGIFNLVITNSGVYRGDIKAFAVGKDAKGNDVWYPIPRKTNYQRDLYEVKLPAGEYRLVVEGNAQDAPKLAVGEPIVTIKENEITEIESRLVTPDHKIRLWFGTIGFDFKELFGDDFVEEEKTLADGKTEKTYKLNNFSKYFDVIDTQTNEELTFKEAPINGYYSEPGYEERAFNLTVQSGEYRIVPKFDINTYKLGNASVVIMSAKDEKTIHENRGFTTIQYAPKEKGSLEVETEFVTNVDTSNIEFMYELYDERNNRVDNLSELLQGIYFLRTWPQEGFRPENQEYKVVINSKNLNQKIKVRWFNMSEESERKNPLVEFGISGTAVVDYKDDIKVKLVNIDTKKEYNVTLVIGKTVTEAIPNGRYKMIVDLKDGWDYNFFTDKGNSGDKTQNEADEVAFTESFNYLELQILRKEKPNYETDYSIEINENGLDANAKRPKYFLEDTTNPRHNYSTEEKKFINIEPGTYTLYVDVEPSGYTAEPKKQIVTVNEDSNDPVKVEINYSKSTNKLKINAVVVDINGKTVDAPEDYLAVQYHAYVEENGNKVFYEIGKLPIGKEITVLPKNLKAPYKLADENKDGIKVTLDGHNEKEITFKYVVDEYRLDTTDLNDAINSAKELLKEKLVPDYKKALEDALKEAEGYLAGNDKTQKGVDDAANALWKVVDNPVFMVTVKFVTDNGMNPTIIYIEPGKTVEKPATDPTKSGFTFAGWFNGDEEFDFAKEIMEDTVIVAKWDKIVVPTPAEPEIPAPDYPSVPYRPRPYRPTTPTKDIVKDTTKPAETTKPTETVTPVEEKKDYGIVETAPTIATTFADLPENEKAGSIMNIVSRGILKGMDNGKFEGELPITRAMVATVLKRLSKDQTTNTVQNFKDVKDKDWFAEAVKWAQSQNLIKGYEDGTFKANKLVTRQELAIIVDRFLKIRGIQMKEIKEISYKDLDKLPTWSKDAIIAMAKIGLIEGETTEKYNPTSKFTREELAVMLEKIIKWVEKH